MVIVLTPTTTVMEGFTNHLIGLTIAVLALNCKWGHKEAQKSKNGEGIWASFRIKSVIDCGPLSIPLHLKNLLRRFSFRVGAERKV